MRAISERKGIASRIINKIRELGDEQMEIVLLELFACYIIAVTLDESVIGELYPIANMCFKLIRYVFYLACVINVLHNFLIYKFDHITYPVIAFLVLSLLVFFISHQQYPLCLCIILGGIHRISFKKILKCGLITSTAVFLFLVTFSIFNIIPDWTFMRGEVVRHSLGYIWPTNVAKAFFLILLMYFYYQKRVKNKEIIFIFLSVIFMYCLTDAKMDLILCLLVVLAIWLMTHTKVFQREISNKIEKVILILFPWLLTLIFIILCVLFDHNNLLAQKLNVLLSSRIQLTVNAWKQYGIKLFGQKINWYGWGGYGYIEQQEDFAYNFVDNAYMKMMLDYGILYLFAFLFSASMTIYEALKNNNTKLVVSLALLFIWATIEPSILEIGRDIFLVLFARTLTKYGSTLNLQHKLDAKMNS